MIKRFEEARTHSARPLVRTVNTAAPSQFKAWLFQLNLFLEAPNENLSFGRCSPFAVRRVICVNYAPRVCRVYNF